MRADLLESYATLDWAVAQLPIMHEYMIAWQRTNPYELAVEIDSETGKSFSVAIEKEPFPLILSVGTNSIIHGLRSSLDLLAAALAKRNGQSPNRNTNFPIFRSAGAANDPNGGLDSNKCKQWLSDSERDVLKGLKPYDGGDPVLWPLHRLDVLCKHERIVRAQASITGALTLGHAQMAVNGVQGTVRIGQKTRLAELPSDGSFTPHHGNTLMVVSVDINEPSLGLINENAIELARRYALRIREIIGLFGA